MTGVFRIDPRIRAALSSQKRLVMAGLACSGGAALLLGVTAKLIQSTINAIEEKDLQTLAVASVGVVAIYVARYFLVRGQGLLLGQAAQRLTADLRTRLFRKLQRLPLTYFGERRSGSIQSVLTNDVTVFQGATSSIRDMIDGPIKIVAGIIAAFWMQWQLALVSLAFFPLMNWVIQRNSKRMKSAQAVAQNDLANLNGITQEQIAGVRVVRAFGAEEKAAEVVGEAIEKTFGSQMGTTRRIATLKPLVELMGAAVLGVTVLICGYLAQRGQLRVSDLAAFVYSLDIVNQGFRNVGSLKQTWAQVEAAADRIHSEVLDLPDGQELATGGQRPGESRGEIEFKDVTFRYPDGTLALDQVSFRLPAGRSLAIVGPSGAGKSTLVDLLLRFHEPESGEILYDGTSVRELDLDWYRSQFGVVPQRTFLFAGTIAENIRLGKPDASEAELTEAARLAHADGFIRGTSGSYGTELGELGTKVSGGEGQRLAIARALIRKPKVLVLDEATSNLDATSERMVTEAFEDSSRGRTAVVVAHRLTTAARLDSILVMAEGGVVDQGSHTELVERGGLYASMYQAFLNRGAAH
ncbi:MAG: ABC transporter ATP-binding protein [Fimbriimonadaceae bacterium]